ncbi:MAG: hypothetical protein COU46_03470 [Candidatus Niyogibacteria bacterium CG10_big_fil_rev_8_21_14_0_10_42_19]|uniref:DUF4878 domain-containing protein n=1 Tax=Candidatus Niyogibacteria bacterium CG10_big_fil_rev_8_21_14_0_10_42_19 TaxID=1974725 RepID=A0A2H0TEU6_9BACT|nr:MAG: hypothetical protein COU46_03470 [Candidatus Niyogibacteria bacterium CG10_big_fil_rev_8_21_14_0_10_42_19]
MFYRSAWKFVFGFIAIISLTLAGLYATDYYLNPNKKFESEVARELEDASRQYMDDTYGGETPEETLELFITALEEGNVELASKYFVVDDQREWFEKLNIIKQNDELKSMIKDIKTAKRGENINDNSSIFSIVNYKNEIITVMNIIRIQNGLWKIEDL